jgi:RNA polymerase sigma-70 factor (ECF subfamily)
MNRKGGPAIKIDEKELVRKAQAGDFEAFTALIDEYRPKIYRLAQKLAKNNQDAEDVLQETFLKAIDKIGQFRAESSFGTWLYTIAVNIVRAKYAKEQKADLMPIEHYLPAKHGHGDEANPLLTDWSDPLSRMSNRELNRKISEALHQLPLKYRVPFTLRYIEEMSVQEVADTLKLSLAATKSRILRARLAMRESLQLFFNEGDEHAPVS